MLGALLFRRPAKGTRDWNGETLEDVVHCVGPVRQPGREPFCSQSGALALISSTIFSLTATTMVLDQFGYVSIHEDASQFTAYEPCNAEALL